MWTAILVKQRLREAFSHRCDGPESPAIPRAKEAIAWLAWLDRSEARLVSLWALAAAERDMPPLRAVLRSRGVAPTTFYRQVNAALDRLVLELEVGAGTVSGDRDPRAAADPGPGNIACCRSDRAPSAG
jgi:hypothetical protein